MPKKSSAKWIELRGVRHNNLKNFDLNLPAGRMIVVTGLSGSGKSSLAFDTLYAEGQRRYIETFSPYARQFFDRMDKPQVDSIVGIPPAIALEQRNAVKTTRSTVGTMTEITEYMKNLWRHLAALHCRGCGQPVRRDTPEQIWKEVGLQTRRASSAKEGPDAKRTECLVLFDVPLSERLSARESLELIAKQGFQRLWWDHGEAPGKGGSAVRIEEALALVEQARPAFVRVAQDRLAVIPENRSRFLEACEQAYHFGKGKLAVYFPEKKRLCRFSRDLHCAECDIEYREATPALFSFNHPLGACPVCRGFGRTIQIDYERAVPDKRLTLEQGVVKPWRTGHGLESQADLMKFCRLRKIPVKAPFAELPQDVQRWVIEGDPDYGKDERHEWPHAWYGVKGYFRWLESKAYKMHVRVLLARYRAYVRCAACAGKRFQPESLLYRVRDGAGAGVTLADFYGWTIEESLAFIRRLTARASPEPAGSQARHKPEPRPHPDTPPEGVAGAGGVGPVGGEGETRGKGKEMALMLCLKEVENRLRYLDEAGLGYLTLDRPTKTLSGGETERVNLTRSLGSGLVNTLFVLDEPTVGLHARDTNRLIGIMEKLRDQGNTLVVVEHEPSVMRAADWIVDLGPGHGESGGEIMYAGPALELGSNTKSLTSQYLSGAREIPVPRKRPVKDGEETSYLWIEHATLHNLRDVSVRIPLGRLVCVTGVSGSGKTTLVREVLYPALVETLGTGQGPRPGEKRAEDGPDEEEGVAHGSVKLTGVEGIASVIMVDQSPLGRTPRSTPIIYVQAFDEVRRLFEQTESARRLGLKAGDFSFNAGQGRCEKCGGAGFEKVEMQFLSDIFLRCGQCQGRRYREHILGVTLESRAGGGRAWNIAQVLEAAVDEAKEFFEGVGEEARSVVEALEVLQKVGLGYLRLGQPINTLSGGESQRLKLAAHIADFRCATLGESGGGSLFIFDEPTTGLHFEDVRILMEVFQELVSEGHTVLLVEHNLEVIKCADWVIDLGPEAGARGGRIVAEGPPEEIPRHGASETGKALKAVFNRF